MMVHTYIISSLRRLCRDDDGAVTVDWVVLTAATVGLALASHAIWRGAAGELSEDIAATASGYQIKTTFD